MLSNIGQIIGQPLAWFEALLNASGVMGIFVSAITITLIIRFIIIPFTGGSTGGRDQEERWKNDNEKIRKQNNRTKQKIREKNKG